MDLAWLWQQEVAQQLKCHNLLCRPLRELLADSRTHAHNYTHTRIQEKCAQNLCVQMQQQMQSIETAAKSFNGKILIFIRQKAFGVSWGVTLLSLRPETMRVWLKLSRLRIHMYFCNSWWSNCALQPSLQTRLQVVDYSQCYCCILLLFSIFQLEYAHISKVRIIVDILQRPQTGFCPSASLPVTV